MIVFIRGKVVEFGSDYVVLDNNGIGYFINFAHPESLTLGQEITIHIFQHFREDATVLYGFLTREELSLFNKLTSVKGMGPKTCIGVLGACKVDNLIDAIENGDVAFLKSLPSIGDKSARQIILDLKGKLVVSQSESEKNELLEDALTGLKSLGFKSNEINSILKELSSHKFSTVDEYLSEGFRLLQKKKG